MNEEETNDTLPEGATLVLKSDEEPVIEKEATQPLTREKFLSIIKRMLEDEEITPSQALEMRRRFGITNASFHNRKVDAKKKKKARKLARWNRMINRHNGSTKGQTKQQNRSK